MMTIRQFIRYECICGVRKGGREREGEGGREREEELKFTEKLLPHHIFLLLIYIYLLLEC